MHAHEVVAVDEAGRREIIVQVPGSPSGLGWPADGRLLVVSMQDRRLLRLEDGRLVEHADLSRLRAVPLQRHGGRRARPRLHVAASASICTAARSSRRRA
jgi:hypothetical protein